MAYPRQGDIQTLGTSRQNLIPHSNNQQHRSPNKNMFIAEPQLTPPTTTDQYHHTETIWRVIIDIISLGICKK